MRIRGGCNNEAKTTAQHFADGTLLNVESLLQSAFPAAASVPDALFCSASQLGQAVEQWHERVAFQGQKIVALKQELRRKDELFEDNR